MSKMSRIDQRLRARRPDPCSKPDQQLRERETETNAPAPDSSTVSSQRRTDTPKHQDFAVPAPRSSVDWADDEVIEFDEDYAEQLSGSVEQHRYLRTCRTNAEIRLQDLRASSRSEAYNDAIEEQKSILEQIAAYENASQMDDQSSLDLDDDDHAMLCELDQASGSSASAEGDGSESGEMSGHMMAPWTPAPFLDVDPANMTPDGPVIESIESYINIHGAQVASREDSEAPAEQRASWSVERPEITSPDLDHVFRWNVKKFLDHTESLVAQFAGAPWSDGVLEVVRREVARLHDELFTVIEAGWAYVDDILWPLVTTGEELVRRAEATGWPREQHLDDFDEVYGIAGEDNQHAASENLQSEAGDFWQKGATIARNLRATDAIEFCRTARRLYPIGSVEDAVLYSTMFDWAVAQSSKRYAVEYLLGCWDHKLHPEEVVVPPAAAEPLLRQQQGALQLWSRLWHQEKGLFLDTKSRAMHDQKPIEQLTLEQFRRRMGTDEIMRLRNVKMQGLAAKEAEKRRNNAMLGAQVRCGSFDDDVSIKEEPRWT